MKSLFFRAPAAFILTLLLPAFINAQTTIVRGIVRDAATHLPLQEATVSFPGGRGSITDVLGNFILQTQREYNKIIITYIGYKKDTVAIKAGIDQTININLIVDTAAKLENVVVKKNRHRGYSNKNNPAVELIRLVLEHKESNRPQAYDFTQYEQYDKLEFSLSNPSDKITNNKLVKNYKFLTENRDTTKLEGKSLLPIYLEETISHTFLRKNPKAEKTKIIATRKVSFGDLVDNNGVTSYLNFIYSDVDIYEPNIVFLNSQLQSPISALAPTFYYFTIQDTVIDERGNKLVKLYFTPRNNGDVLFRGTMLITTDGNYAVRKVDMAISKNININYVKNIKVVQNFDYLPNGRLYLNKSNLLTEFGLSQSKTAQGVFGERLTSYKDFVVNKPQPDSVYKLVEVTDPRAEHPEQPDSFWVANRHDSLNVAESKVYENMDSLIHMKSFQRIMDWGTVLFAGYKNFHSIEIGPIATFYSFNPVEGFRLRFGGRTSTKFSTRWFFNGYGAYGFKDQKWKYFAGAAYSFNNKSIYQFPNNYLSVSYQKEIKIPGQELQFVSEDNFLLSFKRGANDKYLYNKIFRLDYIKEFKNHFSYNLGFKNWIQAPAGALEFSNYKDGVHQQVPDLTTTELSAEIRWAPHETFYQLHNYRSPMYNKYPIFKLRYVQGLKGLVNGEYNYSNFELNIFKKFFFGQFGYTHAIFDAGYVVGQVPWPLLTAHRANQTYAYQLNSYNLMNFLEFVSDHYVSLNLDHNFNGLIFNRIPLLRKFKLREEVTFKILEGGVRSENDPALHPGLYTRPADQNGVPITYSLDKQPYIEASVGIANIFKLLRVDLVKRLTYLDHPNVSPLGIRARIKVDF
jgi:hypothetical protein